MGGVDNAKCGNIMKIYLKIKKEIIADVKFETFACGSAISSGYTANQTVDGDHLSDALQLFCKAAAKELYGLTSVYYAAPCLPSRRLRRRYSIPSYIKYKRCCKHSTFCYISVNRN